MRSLTALPLPDRLRLMRLAHSISLLVCAALLTATLSACRLKTTGAPLALQAATPATLLDSTLGPQSSQSALAQGPLVLVFYRGHW